MINFAAVLLVRHRLSSSAVMYLAGMFLMFPFSVSAAVPAGSACDQAAAEASVQSGVPLAVLMALSRAETGRLQGGQMQPWPWTVNVEGTGAWFPSEPEALAHVRQHLEEGRRSIDIGCFQINHRWHADQFPSLDAMFAPVENASYAAHFLSELYARTGDWTEAAGLYHSGTPELAARYKVRFTQISAELDAGSLRMVSAARQNDYPLLRAGGERALASLTPISVRIRPLIARETQ